MHVRSTAQHRVVPATSATHEWPYKICRDAQTPSLPPMGFWRPASFIPPPQSLDETALHAQRRVPHYQVPITIIQARSTSAVPLNDCVHLGEFQGMALDPNGYSSFRLKTSQSETRVTVGVQCHYPAWSSQTTTAATVIHSSECAVLCKDQQRKGEGLVVTVNRERSDCG